MKKPNGTNANDMENHVIDISISISITFSCVIPVKIGHPLDDNCQQFLAPVLPFDLLNEANSLPIFQTEEILLGTVLQIG